MSDTRFILAGVALVFAGFIVLGIFGEEYASSTVEQIQFDDCYDYFEDRDPVPVSCDALLQGKILFFALVVALIGAGIASLVKGARGGWDQAVRPEDMLGPGGDRNQDGDDPSENPPSGDKR
jgi:hypothetical protein